MGRHKFQTRKRRDKKKKRRKEWMNNPNRKDKKWIDKWDIRDILKFYDDEYCY
jgi:hypothetical protein